MLRGEGFKGKENQTASESHNNGCTAFLSVLRTFSVSAKQMFFFQSNCGTEASIYGSARTPNAEGFSSSPFSEANCLVSLKQEHGKLRVMFEG